MWGGGGGSVPCGLSALILHLDLFCSLGGLGFVCVGGGGGGGRGGGKMGAYACAYNQLCDMVIVTSAIMPTSA